MRLNSTSDSPIRLIHPGIYILSGIVDVRINHGQLVLKAGVFDNRSEITLTKANSQLTRLVILGHSGSITFQALRWLNDIRAGVLQIDYDATVIVASIERGSEIPKLRRTQAIARDIPLGLDIVRDLIIEKMISQAVIHDRLEHPGASIDRIEPLIEQLGNAPSPALIRALESQMAVIYWSRLATIPVQFARKDNPRVPESWKVFGPLKSPLSGSARKAGGPANAMLNYLYALLEAETRVACLTMGLDPGLGIMHTDQPYKKALAYDLMEPIRPEVDSWLLELLSERRFSKGDFFEEASGQIKLTKHLAHELIQTLPLWSRLITPVVEDVTHRLLSVHRPSRTSRSRSTSPDSRPMLRNKPSQGSGGRQSKVSKNERLVHSCLECGKPIHTNTLLCSPECRIAYNENVTYPSFAKAAVPVKSVPMKFPRTKFSKASF